MSSEPSLDELRAAIDATDHALLELVAQRRALVLSIFARKRRLGLPLIDPEREAALLADRLAFARQRGVPEALASRLISTLLEASHAIAEKLAPSGEPG